MRHTREEIIRRTIQEFDLLDRLVLTATPAGISRVAYRQGPGAAAPRGEGRVGKLLDQLQQVRSQGYATDDEETQVGMYCIGVPIIDPGTGNALAAVAVSMLKGSGTLDKREQVVATLQELARLLLNRVKMLR